MSNVYIQEPPTSGKILLLTTVGDIDIELWTKEAPKACRNFMKLCMNGYYNGTIFHRVVKGFIIQGGDPTGTGEGGESIRGHPLKDEFHSRLRFCRRGLVAMANVGKDESGSQFFITLGATPELQNKHTIFGKVVGDTIYNILKLEEVEIDHNERPVYQQKILKAKILLNPFQDLVPTIFINKEDEQQKLDKGKVTGVKNLKLLSFGEEAEEDEEKLSILNKRLSGKSKSAHDNLQDPKLSTITDVEFVSISNKKEKKLSDINQKSSDKEQTLEVPSEKKHKEEIKKRIVDKLKDGKNKIGNVKIDKNNAGNSSEEEYYFHKDRDDQHKEQINAIKKEIKSLKHSMWKRVEINQSIKASKGKEQTTSNEVLNDYMAIQEKYKNAEKKFSNSNTGISRENFTLELLNKFKRKLKNAKEHDNSEGIKNEQDNSNDDDNAWMTHSLQCENQRLILAKDASTKTDDWFEIYDPRNPINKRRRGEKCDNNKRKKN